MQKIVKCYAVSVIEKKGINSSIINNMEQAYLWGNY